MRILLRVLTAAALAVDAYIHLQFASAYDAVTSGVISQGALFRIQAVVAILAALAVLLTGARWAFGFAFLVLASALGAVLLYRYVDVGQLGPLPNMYEPSWYLQKIETTVAEAVGTVIALIGLLVGSSFAHGSRRGVQDLAARLSRSS